MGLCEAAYSSLANQFPSIVSRFSTVSKHEEGDQFERSNKCNVATTVTSAKYKKHDQATNSNFKNDEESNKSIHNDEDCSDKAIKIDHAKINEDKDVFCKSSKMLSWRDFDEHDALYEEVAAAVENENNFDNQPHDSSNVPGS